MDIKKAREIVSALAEGIDPITGELLPGNHVCNNADVVRALYTLLQTNECKNKVKSYENSGKKWSEEDDTLLRQLFNQGVKISEIQKRFMRSRGSIEARLAKLGLIENSYFQRNNMK